MNIIFFLSTQTFGGGQRSSVELASRLNKIYNVKIVDIYGFETSYIDEIKKKGLSLEVIDNVTEPIILNKSKNKIKVALAYITYIKRWLSYRKKFKAICKKFSADIVIVKDLKTLSILSRTSNYRIVFNVRAWYHTRQVSRIKRITLNYFKPVYITVSEATRHAIYNNKLANLEDIYVLQNAIEVEKPGEKPVNDINNDKNVLTILHAGGFLKTKGQHISLAVAQELKKSGIRFKMIFAGFVYDSYLSRNYFKEIESIINQYDLSNCIELVLDNPNVTEYFKICDILIHPSATEGLPRVVMEAMAMGKPVIANPVGGVIDLISHYYTGFIANHNSIEDYVNYILLLQQTPELYNFIAYNGKSLMVNTYTVQKQMKRAESIFTSINSR